MCKHEETNVKRIPRVYRAQAPARFIVVSLRRPPRPGPCLGALGAMEAASHHPPGTPHPNGLLFPVATRLSNNLITSNSPFFHLVGVNMTKLLYCQPIQPSNHRVKQNEITPFIPT